MIGSLSEGVMDLFAMWLLQGRGKEQVSDP